MTVRPFLKSPPQGALLATADLRILCSLDTDEQDLKLEMAQRAAVDMLDGYTGRLGRCILRQVWALPLTDGACAVDLPFPDCRDLAVERFDGSTWSAVDGVALTQRGRRVHLSGLPQDRADLHLTCVAGWETPEDVPQNLVQAVGSLVAHLFDYDPRTWAGLSGGELPRNVAMMIAPLVVVA